MMLMEACMKWQLAVIVANVAMAPGTSLLMELKAVQAANMQDPKPDAVVVHAPGVD